MDKEEPVAQWIEHQPPELGVGGSNPPRLGIEKNKKRVNLKLKVFEKMGAKRVRRG